MTPWENEQHILHIINTSHTKDEILQKLGLSYHNNYGKLCEFMDKRGLLNPKWTPLKTNSK